jgi:glycosyltransferase involved in cell wall biosynthesis
MTFRESPSITVVTPVYNGAEWLAECIESVLGQEYPNFEYGIVDGGSDDGSLDVIRRFEDRLAFCISEQDRGQADALNKGFRRSSSELVCWLNADDFFYPGALRAAADACAEQPDAPFYFGNGDRVDRNGRIKCEFFPGGLVHFRRDALLFGLNYVLQPATFIRRTALEEVGLLDAELQYGFDTDLWLKLSDLGQPRPIRRRVAASREYGETKTATGSFERAEELRRIAESHAGVAATPGSISYYLDTLHREVGMRPDVFPSEYLKKLEAFWAETSDLLKRYGARSDGFPLHSVDEHLAGRSRCRGERLRIGIELRHVTRGIAGGIVAVLTGTLQELFRSRQEIEFVVFCTVFNRDLLRVDTPNVELVTLPLDSFFTELARIARAAELDVLLRSYPSVEQVDFPLSRQVFVLPDIQHEFHPEFFDSRTLQARRLAFQKALGGAAAIMTISNFAGETIRSRTHADVVVAPPGLPDEFARACSRAATADERELVPANEFFLFPANIWPHKNHERLFEALRSCRERTGRDVELVLTGSPSGWEELRARHPDLPIHHLGYVSAQLLRLLYERAVALTFFSLYEGFGIPLLEAFETGTPVVCSNVASLPEVVGDAALMCDPMDVDAISALLERVSSDADLRKQLVARGKRRLGEFTWGTAAERLASALERVAGRTESRRLPRDPVVSIVTPSYNQGRFIRDTIESVLAQSYPRIEYIVVDGGSTDETVEILRSYGDRVRWVSEADSGQAEAINKGLRAARGEIVGYLNSDDVLLPGAIEQIVRYLRAHPECDLVYGDADYIDERGDVIGRYRTAPYSFHRLMEDCCICQPASFWRASASAVVGSFDESLQYALDYDYWIRLDRSGFVLQHLPVTLAQSRLHADAKTLRARREIYDEIFRVCLARGGYVSRGYVDGYWHHRIYERRGPARTLRALPRLRAVPVRAHHALLNRRAHRLPAGMQAARFELRRRVVRRLQRSPRLFAAAVGAHARLRGTQRLLSRGARLRVSGFWPDNWVAEKLDVIVEPRQRACQLQLVGRPVAEMTVRVSANGTDLGVYELSESDFESVEVELPPGPQEVVTFAFSEHAVDARGRRVAFLVRRTNLFREDDLYAVA